MGLDVYLLPNDLGEFLLVLEDGPDEKRLQGVPGGERCILRGVRTWGHHMQMEPTFGTLVLTMRWGSRKA